MYVSHYATHISIKFFLHNEYLDSYNIFSRIVSIASQIKLSYQRFLGLLEMEITHISKKEYKTRLQLRGMGFV